MFKGYGNREISGGSADIADWLANLVESFDGGLTTDSEFFEEFIGEFPESVLVHPEHELSAGSIVAVRFLDVS